jgi:hypothetical protein
MWREPVLLTSGYRPTAWLVPSPETRWTDERLTLEVAKHGGHPGLPGTIATDEFSQADPAGQHCQEDLVT